MEERQVGGMESVYHSCVHTYIHTYIPDQSQHELHDLKAFRKRDAYLYIHTYIHRYDTIKRDDLHTYIHTYIHTL